MEGAAGATISHQQCDRKWHEWCEWHKASAVTWEERCHNAGMRSTPVEVGDAAGNGSKRQETPRHQSTLKLLPYGKMMESNGELRRDMEHFCPFMA